MRSIGRYSLVAVVDVDEFLIPKRHKSLISMVESDPNYDEYNFLVSIYKNHNDRDLQLRKL